MQALRALADITMGLLHGAAYFLKVNLRYFANAVSFSVPYVMYVLGQLRYQEGGCISFGIELVIPVAVVAVVYYLREIANRLGTGNVPPVPHNRFTNVDDDGEVTVENRRIQELLLYMADLEDYFSRKGML